MINRSGVGGMVSGVVTRIENLTRFVTAESANDSTVMCENSDGVFTLTGHL